MTHCEFLFKAEPTAPEEPESSAPEGVEFFEDSQLSTRSKAIAMKTKEIEQVRVRSSPVRPCSSHTFIEFLDCVGLTRWGAEVAVEKIFNLN